MTLYDLITKEDGSVEIKTSLTPDEMRFMLEFALLQLIAMGIAPMSVAKELEENSDQIQSDFLAGVDKDKIGQA